MLVLCRIVNGREERKYVDFGERPGEIALQFLTMRLSGDWGDPVEEPTRPAPFVYTQEQFFALDPESPDYKKIADQYAIAVRDHKEYDTAVRRYLAITTCVRNGDKRLAPAILEERLFLSDEPYEFAFLYDGIPPVSDEDQD